MRLKVFAMGLLALACGFAAAGTVDDDFLMLNILPYSPGRETELAAEAVTYREKTGFDFVLYCLTCDVEGVPASRKVGELTASFRKFKAALDGKGVRTGILLQACVGHWLRAEKESEPWTRTRGAEGKEGSRRCWLDSRFAAYLKETAAALAREKPAFILGDDDIRPFGHAGEECFCDLHAAAFAKLTGRATCTSEEMRRIVAAAKRGSPDEAAFRRLQREMVNGVCRLIREGIDSVDPSIPTGVCMPVMAEETRFYDQAARAIAGPRHKTVIRIGNGQYLEREPKTVASRVMTSYALAEVHRGVDYLLDEADTYPQTLWSRSSSGMHAKICMSLMCGFRGALPWYVGTTREGFPVSENYTRVFGENAGLYRALAKACRGSRTAGIAIPLCTTFPSVWSQFTEGETWGEAVFAELGVPFRAAKTFDDPAAVYAVTGAKAIGRFADADLRALLARTLLLDAAAAEAIAKRGFGDLIGVTADSSLKPKFVTELKADGKSRLQLGGFASVVALRDADPKAEVLTTLAWAPYAQSPDLRTVAPATTLFENRLGGRVAVTTWHPGVIKGFGGGPFTEGRRRWLLELLARLNGEPLAFAADHDQDFLLQERTCADGSTLLLAANLNYDAVPSVRLRTAKRPNKLEVLSGKGEWEPVDFSFDGGVVTVPRPLPCYGVLVMRTGR